MVDEIEVSENKEALIVLAGTVAGAPGTLGHRGCGPVGRNQQASEERFVGLAIDHRERRALLLALAWGLPASGALNPYVVQILMYVGINMILTLSLNLVNGYMGEFSVGHAGFMGIGAYVAAILTVAVLPRDLCIWLFPGVLIIGGLAAVAVAAAADTRARGEQLARVQAGHDQRDAQR